LIGGGFEDWITSLCQPEFGTVQVTPVQPSRGEEFTHSHWWLPDAVVATEAVARDLMRDAIPFTNGGSVMQTVQTAKQSTPSAEDAKRWEFAKPLRAKSPAVSWKTIADQYRKQTAEPVDESSMKQSCYRAKKTENQAPTM
jgi:hypothetical protein